MVEIEVTRGEGGARSRSGGKQRFRYLACRSEKRRVVVKGMVEGVEAEAMDAEILRTLQAI